MIVYTATKARFRQDVMGNDIGGIIFDTFKAVTGHGTKRSEIDSWTNSLRYMHAVLEDPAIPATAGVAIEYHIPRSSKRIDFILTGTDAQHTDTAILVELKQWQQADLTAKDGIVVTTFKGGPQETPHPSYQAWTYNPNSAVPGRIPRSSGSRTKRYARSVREGVCRPARVPAMRGKSFSRNFSAKRLPFLRNNGKIKPSNNLADSLAGMLNPNPAGHGWIPRSSGPRAKRYARQARGGVCRPEGAPAMRGVSSSRNLPARGNQQYVTRNSAPRLVYAAKLAGTLKRSRIDNMFRSSETFHKARPNEYDCLIVDEVRPGFRARHNYASRPGRKTGGDFSSKIAEAGSRKTAMRFMRDHRPREKVTCPLSPGYLAWLDYALGIAKASANDTLDTGDYDFRVLDDPAQLHALIRQKNTSNKARVVAGYCWPWLSKKDPGRPTCQGLELAESSTYRTLMTRGLNPNPALRRIPRAAGRGPSAMRARPEGVYASRRAPAMRAENFSRSFQAKGCYVHFTDEETARHFKALLAPAPAAQAAPAAAALKVLFRIEEEVAAALKFVAYLPVFSLQAACGNFGRGMAVEPLGWIKCPPGLKPDHNMFAAQVAGRSMEPKLQDGDYCVFRANPGGSRQNKLVLVQHSSIADPDAGGSYTVIPNSACGITREAGGGPSAMRARPDGVYATRRAPAMRVENFIRSFLAKKYTSKKKYAPDGAWQHEEIILQPLNPAYSPIVIPNAEDEEFMVVAEVVGQCEAL